MPAVVKSAPTLPAVPKSPPARRSSQTAVAMPAGVSAESAGGEIDHPVLLPKSSVSVAVKVAPPVTVVFCKPPHFKVQAPDATEIVAIRFVPEEQAKIGFPCVPVQVKALLMVVVEPPVKLGLQPELTVKLEKVFAPVIAKMQGLVVALSVMPL